MVPFLFGQHERLEKKMKHSERILDRFIGEGMVKFNRLKKVDFLSYVEVEQYSQQTRISHASISKEILRSAVYQSHHIFVLCFLDEQLNLIMERPGSRIPLGKRWVAKELDESLKRYTLSRHKQ